MTSSCHDKQSDMPPHSPDLNLFDAGIFCYLGRQQQEEGALTLEEIRKSVQVVYDELK